MIPLVLIRHGQSVWNKEDRFTGWTDVDLSEGGVAEARQAARLLAQHGYQFDVCFTSVLKRAIRTLHIVLEDTDQLWLPVHKHWRLNERHYGDLQGLNKEETRRKVGKEQVFEWRRSYATRPPALEEGDPRSARNDRRYADLEPSQVPMTESLQDTVARVVPYWQDAIAPQLKEGRRVVIAAHGNSLRGLAKHLDNISDEEIPLLEIPTGKPLVYELDEQLRPIRHFYLE